MREKPFKLSKLIGFRNHLNATLTVKGIHNSVESLIDQLSRMSIDQLPSPDNTPMRVGIHHEYMEGYVERLQFIQSLIVEIEEMLQKENRTITNQLEVLSKKFYLANYDLELAYDTAESIREARKMTITKKADEDLRTRIGKYVDWKYPILELGCRDGEMTKELVAGDPLYIVDNYQEFIDSTMASFNPQYQHRVRPYVIRDNQPYEGPGPNVDDFAKLPQEQFGFVFSYNYFNYRSIQGIKDYLGLLHKVMRPGGVMMFTYNNADQEQQAAYAEGYFMSYMPKSLLIPLCQSMGFDIITTHDIGVLSWIEIKKPGELESIKAHQALARVLEVDKYPKELTF